MKLFMKCLKDGFKEHFKEYNDIYVCIAGLTLAVMITPVLERGVEIAVEFGEAVCTYFKIDDMLIKFLICMILPLITCGILFVLIDILRRAVKKKKNED